MTYTGRSDFSARTSSGSSDGRSSILFLLNGLASPDRARIDVFDGRHLLGLNQEAFARRGAEILGTLNTVHPFREGNGTQREFVRELAHKNGYWVDWSKVSRGELYKHCDVSFMRCENELSKSYLRKQSSRVAECGFRAIRDRHYVPAPTKVGKRISAR